MISHDEAESWRPTPRWRSSCPTRCANTTPTRAPSSSGSPNGAAPMQRAHRRRGRGRRHRHRHLARASELRRRRHYPARRQVRPPVRVRQHGSQPERRSVHLQQQADRCPADARHLPRRDRRRARRVRLGPRRRRPRHAHRVDRRPATPTSRPTIFGRRRRHRSRASPRGPGHRLQGPRQPGRLHVRPGGRHRPGGRRRRRRDQLLDRRRRRASSAPTTSPSCSPPTPACSSPRRPATADRAPARSAVPPTTRGSPTVGASTQERFFRARSSRRPVGARGWAGGQLDTAVRCRAPRSTLAPRASHWSTPSSPAASLCIPGDARSGRGHRQDRAVPARRRRPRRQEPRRLRPAASG